MPSSHDTLTLKRLVLHAAVFFVFYQVFLYFPSGWAEMATTRICFVILNLLGFSSSYGLEKDFFYLTLNGGTRSVCVFIIRECSAIHVVGVIIGLIAPLTARLGDKLKAVLLGTLIIFSMNISRILLTVFLTGYDVPPFSWFLTNPTVDTFHYPISFLYGVVGIVATIFILDRLIIPELGEFLSEIPETITRSLRKMY